jgi:tubulin-specific chaperone A
MYRAEVLTEQARFERFRAEGKDEHDLGQQQRVIDESVEMIDDTGRRLRTALDELRELIEQVESEDDVVVAASPEFETAKTVCADAEAILTPST